MTIENSVQHNTNSVQLLASFKNCKMSRRCIVVTSHENGEGALQDITDDEFELEND